MYNTKLYQLAARGLLFFVFVFICLTFRQHGISNDEEVQHVYGRLLLKFYESGFHDQSAFHYKNLYLYGGFFDLIAASLERLNLLWLWDLRHLLTGLFGLLGLAAVYRISKEIEGQRTGFFAVLLLSLTAAWSGAMFTHTKDIPFATCMAWALYYSIVACKALPNIRLRTSVKIGVAIGCALGMRIGGGFSVIYLLLTLAYTALTLHANRQSKLQFWLKSIMHLQPAAILAFVLMAVFWPWGVMEPSHPLEAIKAFSYFSFNMLTIDDGRVMSIGDVPRTYLLSYLLVRLPEVFLIGLAGFFSFGFLKSKQVIAPTSDQQKIALAAVVIAFAFPMLFVILTKPALYNGVRHFTFILPPLAILAGYGMHLTLAYFQKSAKLKIGYIVICVLLMAVTVTKLVQLHPYEYIYYNELAGDTNDAEKHWESDYWSSSLRAASKTLTNLSLPKSDKPYLVAVCAENVQGSAYLDDRFQITKNWNAADFYMSTTNMHCDQVLKGEIIGVVKRSDTTLAVVKDRRKLVGEARDATPAPN